MTVVTGLFTVFSFEFIPGIPVMIKNRTIPAFLVVTGFTITAKPAGVNIPDRMAIHTLFGGIFVYAFKVAGVTGHLLV